MKEYQPVTIFFYLTCLATVIAALFLDKTYLSIILPITFLSLILTYVIAIRKAKSISINYFFISSLVCLMLVYYLIYTNFLDYFTSICILVSIFCLFCALSLKQHFLNIKYARKNPFDLAFIMAIVLILFVAFAVSYFVLELRPDATVVIYATTLLVVLFVGICYYIYSSYVYMYGIKLFVSAIIFLFVVCFYAINEMMLLSKVLTFFVVTSHVLSMYLFMSFLLEQDPKDCQDVSNKVL